MNVTVKADSVNPEGGRITTMLGVYPRCIHSEHLRHRMFSFSVASSRAIPFNKLLRKVDSDPFLPTITMNKAGMSGEECLDEDMVTRAHAIIGRLARNAVDAAALLGDLGIHKQVINRYLEPFLNTVVLFTGTEGAWMNFFNLRCHAAAEPHIHQFADLCRDAYDSSEPRHLGWGDWHMPFEDKMPREEYEEIKVRISAARCARLSYETHDTKEIDYDADIALAEKLLNMNHVSPFEHQAVAVIYPEPNQGNFRGEWAQARHLIQNNLL